MAIPTKPRKSKRQKREQSDATTIKSEENAHKQSSNHLPFWKVKAEEAVLYRNDSLEETTPSLPEADIESNAQRTPAGILDETTDKSLDKLSPEDIVRLISKGELDSATITNALLRRARGAAKLVSTQHPQIFFHLTLFLDQLCDRTASISRP